MFSTILSRPTISNRSLTTQRLQQDLCPIVENSRAMVARRTARSVAIVGVLAALAAIGYALRWRRNPSPCPYSQRVWIDLPRPVISRSGLREILEPQPGEQILELGPGTGYYTGSVAQAVAPSGTVHAVDIQREMLADLRTRLREHGHDNVAPLCGDGQALPYPDDS